VNRGIREILPFLFPLGIFILGFLLLPVAGGFWVSLWRDVTFLSRKFVGLENYVRLFQDFQFWNAAAFTLLFAGCSVILELVLGTIVALVINEKIPLRGLFRGVALLPWVIPCVIGARIWQLILRYDYGLANFVLEKSLGRSVNWLGSPSGAFFSLVGADVWRTTPFVAIIILAGLQTVRAVLYEQAKVDGAGIWQRFWKITLPCLRPFLIVALLFRTIDALRVFDIIYVITGGGPGGRTTSLSLYGYKYFLLGDFGYGAAVSVFLFLLAFVLALCYLRVGRFREVVL
jgi:multiple sugar transport system permease protein